MKLSIIILNYNVKYFLEQALLSVRKALKDIDVEVFVVDNNSVDDSVDMVREKFPEFTLIANKVNGGFSKGNNQAMKLAVGEYILLLNPDTVIEEDTLEKVIAFMDAHPDAGGLGVKMIDGAGNFLPESKRGFPSPFVAFCKTFGLSKLFPKSEKFNRYHLGYLDKDENHEVDILSGAFMLMRKEALDKVGLLDEAFFMYGEDIDLSYRLILGGYKNYYCSDTTIIHYKGESTKKGSLNYVRTFYNAMIIFAKKHFKGEQARLFVGMLQFAIYFRASLTLLSNFIKKAYLPILDALLIVGGMIVLKDFWATNYYNDPNYYSPIFTTVNIPLYTLIWLTAVYFSSGYDAAYSIRRVVRGLFVGTIFLAAVYGFLDLEYRTSRMLIVFGAVWATVAMIGLRMTLHFIKYRNFNMGKSKVQNLVIVGSKEESERVINLIRKVRNHNNFIGTVSPNEVTDHKSYIGSLHQLDEIVHIYKIDEIVFCSQDVSSQKVMHWMTRLGPNIFYKTVPQESISIIGSHSKNSSGSLYTIDIQFDIATTANRRNKRMFDILMSLMLLVLSPLIIWFVKNKGNYLKHCFQVFFGRKTWVSYTSSNGKKEDLPKLRKGVFSPVDALNIENFSEPTLQRLNFFYAKDYTVYQDWEILWKGL